MNKETRKVLEKISESNEVVLILNKYRNFKDFSDALSRFVVDTVNNDDKLKKLDRKKIDLILISKELF